MRDVDPPATSGLLAFVQRAENAEGGIEAGHRIGDRRPHDARIVRIDQQAQPAARGLRDRVIGRPARIRPLAAKAGNAAIDQRRIELLKPLGADIELLGDAGAEILDEDIGLRDQLVEKRQIVGLARCRASGCACCGCRSGSAGCKSPPLKARKGSPVSGRSSLTTSAPMSARYMPAAGPVMNVPISRTRTSSRTLIILAPVPRGHQTGRLGRPPAAARIEPPSQGEAGRVSFSGCRSQFRYLVILPFRARPRPAATARTV